MVAKLDRLGRDAQDVGATVKLLASRKISVIVLQLGKLDLTSPAGKMMLTMLAAVAEMERDMLVERTHSGRLGASKERRQDAGAAVENQRRAASQHRFEVCSWRERQCSGPPV